MPGIHVRDLPQDVLDALKRRAKLSRRSLQKEVHVILERAAHETPALDPPGSILQHVALGNADAPPDFAWSREDIYDDDGR